MNRGGAALFLAVVVLSAVGAIVASALLLARAERAQGTAAVAEVQARGAAEAAVAEALLGWPKGLTPSRPGESVPLSTITRPGGAQASASVRALGGPILAIRGEGVRRDAAGGILARVAIELLVRLDSTAGDSVIRPKRYPRGWRLLP
ncbi:MAG: hypothetical protein HOP28_12505 [Gemmatimonadales bacterium]|nr:hypothetical protein [Gemmatimonadales bacterium]